MSVERESAQPCGCDAGASYKCLWHRIDTRPPDHKGESHAGLLYERPSHADTFVDVARDAYPAPRPATLSEIEDVNLLRQDRGLPLIPIPRNIRDTILSDAENYMTGAYIRRPYISSTLPVIAAERKQYPIATGVLGYFPLSMAAIAHVSYLGNEQHNPGESLRWSREKSSDHPDCLIRHFLQRGTLDVDGMPHSAKCAWRALAILELELEGK